MVALLWLSAHREKELGRPRSWYPAGFFARHLPDDLSVRYSAELGAGGNDGSERYGTEVARFLDRLLGEEGSVRAPEVKEQLAHLVLYRDCAGRRGRCAGGGVERAWRVELVFGSSVGMAEKSFRILEAGVEVEPESLCLQRSGLYHRIHWKS
jgi:hypothetical protein